MKIINANLSYVHPSRPQPNWKIKHQFVRLHDESKCKLSLLHTKSVDSYKVKAAPLPAKQEQGGSRGIALSIVHADANRRWWSPPCSSHFMPRKETQYLLYWWPVHSYKELFVLFYILCSNLSIRLLHTVKLPSLARHQTTVLWLLTLPSQTSLHTCTAHSQVPLFWYQFTLLYEVTPQFSAHYHPTLRHTIHKTANDLNHNIRDDMIFCTP